jgi:hypothetical protein
MGILYFSGFEREKGHSPADWNDGVRLGEVDGTSGIAPRFSGRQDDFGRGYMCGYAETCNKTVVSSNLGECTLLHGRDGKTYTETGQPLAKCEVDWLSPDGGSE